MVTVTYYTIPPLSNECSLIWLLVSFLQFKHWHTGLWKLTFWMCVCVVPGGLPSEGGADQGDAVPNAPQQHPWSRGHVHTGRAARSCHHAQPLSALPERQHLCKAPHCLNLWAPLPCTTMMCLQSVGPLCCSGVFFWELGCAAQLDWDTKWNQSQTVKNINRKCQFLQTRCNNKMFPLSHSCYYYFNYFFSRFLQCEIQINPGMHWRLFRAEFSFKNARFQICLFDPSSLPGLFSW